jgi:catechol 2,3-dioxygenase-like lactoylglutathione lyase family enzyme
MLLGNFSVSLNVADIAKSRDFYTKLGFIQIGGDESQNWLILKNGASIIGIFQGMFDKNIMTFNPGWDGAGGELDSFTDVRDIQKKLKAGGIEILDATDESSTGPASCMVADPDGNQILFDQHV